MKNFLSLSVSVGVLLAGNLAYAQKIESIEWLSPTTQPKGFSDLIGKDVQSKDFSSALKALRATEEYQDLEYRFDGGRLFLSSKAKVFVREISWIFPSYVPDYVKDDMAVYLDIQEDDVLPQDTSERVSRLKNRIKARGYSNLDVKFNTVGENEDKSLLVEFFENGKAQDHFRRVEFRGIDDSKLLRNLANKVSDLKSLSSIRWKNVQNSYEADNVFVKDEIELEEFRIETRKRMRARGFLNFELDIHSDQGDSLVISTRNLRQFEFQFSGQTFYWENELRSLLLENLSDRNFDIEEAKFLVTDAYFRKGFRDVDVDSRIESVGSKYTVFFQISEGRQYFFKGIDFKNVRDEFLPLLRSAESVWLEPFKSPLRNSYFDEEGLRTSLGVLVEAIRARGFLDVDVSDYDFELKPGSSFASLKLSLRLGPRYRYSDFKVSDEDGKLMLDEDDILVQPLAGTFYDGDYLQGFLRDLKKQYEEQGYLYSEVETTPAKILEKNPLLNTVQVNIPVRRGPKVYLRNIQIRGNTRTKKKVILREMDSDALEYGEVITPTKTREFETRLLGTGLFSTVDLKPVGSNMEFRGEKNYIDYDLSLKERPGGGIEFGPGFRTDLGLVGFGEFSYRNLGGWNRGVFAKGQVSHKLQNYQFLEQAYSATFVEPYPLDLRSRLILDVRYRLDDDIQYEGSVPIKGFNTEETSTSLKLEKRFAEHLTVVATLYQYSLPRIFNIISDTSETTQKYRLGGNGIEFLVDYRDNIFNPLSGWFVSEEVEYFSPYLGSDQNVNFITTKTRFNYYVHLGKEAVIALSLGYDHLWGITSNSIIPENKRLTLGGRSSLRSLPENFLRFDEEGVAEQRAFLGRFEYRMPLFSGWGMAAFYEVGEVDVLTDKVGLGERSTGLRHGSGFGIRYKTPVGPLSVDWAYNFSAREDEDDYQISLSIGAF